MSPQAEVENARRELIEAATKYIVVLARWGFYIPSSMTFNIPPGLQQTGRALDC